MLLTRPVSQRVYFPAVTPGTLVVAPNVLYALPFFVGQNFDPDQFKFTITSAHSGSGDNVKLGIYSDNGGIPGKLLVQNTVTAFGTGTGMISSTLVNDYKPFLRPGVYWLASLWDTAGTTQATVAAAAAGLNNGLIQAALGVATAGVLPSSAATSINGVAVTSQTYASGLASDFSTLSAAYATNGAVPLIGLRAR